MKKVLLKIGFVLCLLLTALFAKAARHFLLYDIETSFASVIFGTGPLLGMIALLYELREQRSKKILIALGIWAAFMAIIFIFFL